MTALTIAAAEAQINSLAATLIAQLRAGSRKANPLRTTSPALIPRAGERFVGAIQDAEGNLDHYVFLLPAIEGKHSHAAALAAAKAAGGDLPSPREAWLLHAQGMFPNWWIWLNKLEGSSFAWLCTHGGFQYYLDRSAGGGAVAVRRVFPSDL